MQLTCRNRVLDLGAPAVMGVLNVTPDSFSDGGRYLDVHAAVEHGLRMADEGAAIIDVGGESTRPGSVAVPESEELDRVVPVIERIAQRSPVLLSVDTRKPAVMSAAVAAGAHLINDVNGLQARGALEAAARSGAAVCLMHMQGEPATMQVEPHYDDVLAEVSAYLAARAAACIDAGVPATRICIDPGIGFGKRLEHNLALLNGLPSLARLGFPVLIGVSRKSMIGMITGRPADQRLAGSFVLAAMAVERGAAIIRAHDVAGTVDAVRIAAQLMRRSG
ncbi:MAG TPA: dihydropteroate synthase [Steroidobacteraceae bacterium]